MNEQEQSVAEYLAHRMDDYVSACCDGDEMGQRLARAKIEAADRTITALAPENRALIWQAAIAIGVALAPGYSVYHRDFAKEYEV